MDSVAREIAGGAVRLSVTVTAFDAYRTGININVLCGDCCTPKKADDCQYRLHYRIIHVLWLFG